MLGRMREGLQDVPVSRTSFSWGIPVPGNEDHVLWVWLDALSNYITTLGLGEPEGDVYAERAKYWPPDYHVVGKEILFFHSLFWPAVLIALDIPLPRCIYAHSFWISEGKKMSKSLGNFIDLATIERYLDAYGLDMWRYFLASEGPMGATDSDFYASHFHDIYSTDLVNTVGNCASRVTAMINKYFQGIVPIESPSDNSSYFEEREVVFAPGSSRFCITCSTAASKRKSAKRRFQIPCSIALQMNPPLMSRFPHGIWPTWTGNMLMSGSNRQLTTSSPNTEACCCYGTLRA